VCPTSNEDVFPGTPNCKTLPLLLLVLVSDPGHTSPPHSARVCFCNSHFFLLPFLPNGLAGLLGCEPKKVYIVESSHYSSSIYPGAPLQRIRYFLFSGANQKFTVSSLRSKRPASEVTSVFLDDPLFFVHFECVCF